MTWYVDVHVNSCLAHPPFAFEKLHIHEYSPPYLLQWPLTNDSKDYINEQLKQQHKLKVGVYAFSTLLKFYITFTNLLTLWAITHNISKFWKSQANGT